MHPNFPADEFRSFLQHTLDTWHFPGIAVAVIKDGQVIFCDGLGLRDRDRALPMTGDTILPIASCTKAFTAMTVALLVEEGKLEWDTPIRTWLPDFKLYDEVATAQMTPRDLLCHRSGLPRHDLLWYCSSFSREEIFARLRYVEPSRAFRSAYQYQNMMFMAAGLMVGRVAGTSWENFVQARILDPLGMSRTNLSTVVTERDENHARPYIYKNEKLREIPFWTADGEKDALGPAGNICSSVSDLSRWLTLHMNGGCLDGRQFVLPATLRQMHTPHIFVDDPLERERLGLEFQSYCLGWNACSYKGEKLVGHGGNMDGFASYVSFMPRQNIGVVVLTNGDGYYNQAPRAVSYTIYDRLLALPPTDWNARFQSIANEDVQSEHDRKSASAAERKTAPPSHPIADYLGEYEHPGYGILSVCQGEAGLQLVINEREKLLLAHDHYDIFEAGSDNFTTPIILSFATDRKGHISSLSTRMEVMVPAVTFVRRPDPALAGPALLSKFVGEYRSRGLSYYVTLRSGHLHLTAPDLSRDLIPYRETEFQVQGGEDISIKFILDEEGVCTGTILNQLGAVFTAQKI